MDIKLIQGLLDFNYKMNFEYQSKKLENIDFVDLLGFLNINRISAIAYKVIVDQEINALKRNSEFMRNLDINYRYGLSLNNYMKRDLIELQKILGNTKCQYAFLKGAFLSMTLYPKGLRTSNDVDILVHMKDLDEIERILSEYGFEQGYIRHNGAFKKASRQEIIRARMNYGEVMPYTKHFSDHYLRVDINLSLDYKPLDGNSVVAEMLNNRQYFSVDSGVFSPTLSPHDFFIHLCCHLYKEATTYHWVVNNRDLTLYKFSDIYVYLHAYINEKLAKDLEHFIKKYGVEKECYYAIENSMKLYPSLRNIKELSLLLGEIKPKDIAFMYQVIRPDMKELYTYTIEFEKRLFENNKLLYLQKIDG